MSLPRVLPQEVEEECGQCLQLVAAVQLELGTDATFAQALVAHAERACGLLAPHLAHWVRAPASHGASRPHQVTAAWEHLLRLGGSGWVLGCVSPPPPRDADTLSHPHSAGGTWPSAPMWPPSCSGTW